MVEKIEAQWSIGHQVRTARYSGLLLVALNGRDGRWGPCRWAVGLDTTPFRPLRSGEVYQPGRYQALVNEAMFQAEQAAREVAFDLLVG